MKVQMNGLIDGYIDRYMGGWVDAKLDGCMTR